MATCKIEISTLPSLTSCPEDTEQLLFFKVPGQPQAMATRAWSTIVQCLLQRIFGTGALDVLGTSFDGSGKYFNSDLINSLLVFHNGIARFLILGTEWAYLFDVYGNVNGIQVLVGIDPADNIFILPNPVNP